MLDQSQSLDMSLEFDPAHVRLLPSFAKAVMDPETGMDLLKKPMLLVDKNFSPGSLKGSSSTLTFATLGVGILSLPLALSKSGLAFGTLQLAVCAVFGFYSSYLLVQSANTVKMYSYQKLALISYGKRFSFFVKFLFFSINWLQNVPYTIMINKLIARSWQTLFGNTSTMLTDTNGLFWQPVLVTLFVLPMCLARELKSLRYLYLFGVICVAVLTFAVVYETFNSTICDGWENFKHARYWRWDGFSNTFSIAVFSFVPHNNVLDVFYELKRPTRVRMKKVLKVTFKTTVLMYMLVSAFGYTSFAPSFNNDEESPDNILDEDYHNQAIITIAAIMCAISFIMSIPLCIKPARDTLRDLLYPYNLDNPNSADNVDSNLLHVTLVLSLVYSQTVIAMFYQHAASACVFLGSTVAPVLYFVVPSMIFMKVSTEPKFSRPRIICSIFGVFSVIFTFYSTIMFFLTSSNS